MLVLYDVPSSYFEGECNELGQYGYNRDGKKGKRQIVIGLLTAADGEPLAARVFEGTPADPATVASQIVRRNETVRVREQRRRAEKLHQLQAKIAERNAFIAKSPRASAEKGLAALRGWVKRHQLANFVTLALEERASLCAIDEIAMAEDGLLDGCYLLETDVPAALLDAPTVDQRYRDLQKVERDFRTVKTTFLELRPIFLRKAERTKAHVFVAMLALKITRQFETGLRQAFGMTDEDAAARPAPWRTEAAEAPGFKG